MASAGFQYGEYVIASEKSTKNSLFLLKKGHKWNSTLGIVSHDYLLSQESTDDFRTHLDHPVYIRQATLTMC